MMLQTPKILLLTVTSFRYITYTLLHLRLSYMIVSRSLFHLTGIHQHCLGIFPIHYFCNFLALRSFQLLGIYYYHYNFMQYISNKLYWAGSYRHMGRTLQLAWVLEVKICCVSDRTVPLQFLLLSSEGIWRILEMLCSQMGKALHYYREKQEMANKKYQQLIETKELFCKHQYFFLLNLIYLCVKV